MTQEIDNILNFSKGNILVYNSICKEIIESSNGRGVMPFIGDGLTEFAFGDNKSFIDDVLNQINDTLSETQQQSVQEKEETKGFIEALDELINILGGKYGEDVINKHLEEFYSDEKIDIYTLENQAVSLVPLLNYGDSVTSNFDRVLEYAYELAGINPSIATPYDCNVLNNKIRSNTEINKALLFKIHGDIISNATERIITKGAFEKNYKDNPTFLENLTKWIQKYKLLFIGVDLIKNKYLKDVLEKTKSEGSNHYAIVGCKDDDKLKEEIKNSLAKLNIMPIIYNIEKSVSVEIILHKILVDTKNERILKNSNRGEYHYKYSEHDLVGREKEIEKLEEFLSLKSKYAYFDFSWWMIWGKDVAGKSKLSYEFARKYANTWDWYMIVPGQIDDFIEKQKKVNKMNRQLFVIFDDFDCYSGGISNIFNFVKNVIKYCKKIRVLFIVRDYKTSEICKIANDRERKDEVRIMLLHSAYASPREICQLSVNDIKETCYKYIWYRKRNLGLDNLQEEELLNIDDELEKYISNQINEDKSLLLLCSLEKAINLILKKNVGNSDNDDIINKIMRYVLTDGEGNLNNPNVNIIEIDRRKDYRKGQAKKLMIKYDKEKEYNKDYFNSAYETDGFIFEFEKE